MPNEPTDYPVLRHLSSELPQLLAELDRLRSDVSMLVKKVGQLQGDEPY